MKLVYVVGSGRCGSTLLDRLLGQMDGFFSTGELFAWHRVYVKNNLCGCGKPLRECDFWSAVIQEAFGQEVNSAINEIQRLEIAVKQVRFIPMIQSPVFRTLEYDEKLAAYSNIISIVYAAIKKISKREFIVDSSKSATYGYILNQVHNIELNVIHLVRDSRAVAFSMQRKKMIPGVNWKVEYMRIFNPFQSSLRWAGTNALGQTLKRATPNYSLLRYEKLMKRPKAILEIIARRLGAPDPRLDFFISDRAVNLQANHTVAGNPSRFQKGTVELLLDNEWQTRMSKPDRLTVTAMTLPLLSRYGYLTFGWMSTCRHLKQKMWPEDKVANEPSLRE